MFYYLTAFVFIFHLPIATFAIACSECSQVLKLDFLEGLNMERPECIKKHGASGMCMAHLSIHYEHRNATVLFNHLTDNEMILSNQNKIVANSIIIWLTKNVTYQSLQSFCTKSEDCVEEVKNTYNMMKTFPTNQLRTNLRKLLTSDHSHVSNLTCSDNQNLTVSCPNGFCQLIRKDKSNVDRKCIPQGDSTNPSGVHIQSNSTEEPYAEVTVTYACTKPMCNGAETDARVQQLLKQYGALPSSDRTTTSTTSIAGTNNTDSNSTEITTPPESNTAMAILHQTKMIFQRMLVLSMTILLKI